MKPNIEDILKKFREIGLDVGNNILKENRKYILSNGKAKLKDDGYKRDYVVPPDKQSEKALVAFIKKNYPGMLIIGEEGGRCFPDTDAFKDCFFLIDPLDGTGIYSGKVQEVLKKQDEVEFLKELGLVPKDDDFNKYCLHLNYSEGDISVVDYSFFPETGEEVFALKGKGSFYRKNGSEQRILVSDKRTLDDAVIGVAILKTVYTQKFIERYSTLLKAMEETLKRFTKEKRFAYTSAIYETCATAFAKNHRERNDIYVNPQIYQWDHPSLVVKEARGKSIMIVKKGEKFEIKEFSYRHFNNFDKGDDTFKKSYGIVTGNPWVVDKFVKTIEKSL